MALRTGDAANGFSGEVSIRTGAAVNGAAGDIEFSVGFGQVGRADGGRLLLSSGDAMDAASEARLCRDSGDSGVGGSGGEGEWGEGCLLASLPLCRACMRLALFSCTSRRCSADGIAVRPASTFVFATVPASSSVEEIYAPAPWVGGVEGRVVPAEPVPIMLARRPKWSNSSKMGSSW